MYSLWFINELREICNITFDDTTSKIQNKTFVPYSFAVVLISINICFELFDFFPLMIDIILKGDVLVF